ncbi:MAG: thioredoxin family protein [Gemmataceae bacterium]|nr:thioredoxin family protein [Gemmataceae bacterium]
MESLHAAAVRTVALTVLFVSIPSALQAQEIRWRTDYSAALRESQAKKRPLFVDFTAPNCIWCQRLDANTFSQGSVARLLNDRFVPLKLDGHRATAIAQALGVQRYPTMVFAAPNGNILMVREGFEDAETFTARAERALRESAEQKEPEVAEAEKIDIQD